MRPIKYRAWDNKKHFWLNPEYFYVTGEGRGFTCEHSKGMYSDSYELMGTNRYTIIQFTGLLDKNGKETKEIYEGDIVQDNNPKLPHLGKDKYEVVFEIKGWSSEFGFQVLPHRKWTYGGHGKYLKVIGNIHESPELIEETKCDL